MHYYIVDAATQVDGYINTRTNHDGTLAVYKFDTARSDLGDALTHEEAVSQTSTEVWNGPPPGG